MSNSQWHEDQSVGEAALRRHARLVERAPQAFELLRRITRYAREDKVRTPGTTRLARVIEDAEALLTEADRG